MNINQYFIQLFKQNKKKCNIYSIKSNDGSNDHGCFVHLRTAFLYLLLSQNNKANKTRIPEMIKFFPKQSYCP